MLLHYPTSTRVQKGAKGREVLEIWCIGNPLGAVHFDSCLARTMKKELWGWNVIKHSTFSVYCVGLIRGWHSYYVSSHDDVIVCSDHCLKAVNWQKHFTLREADCAKTLFLRTWCFCWILWCLHLAEEAKGKFYGEANPATETSFSTLHWKWNTVDIKYSCLLCIRSTTTAQDPTS